MNSVSCMPECIRMQNFIKKSLNVFSLISFRNAVLLLTNEEFFCSGTIVTSRRIVTGKFKFKNSLFIHKLVTNFNF